MIRIYDLVKHVLFIFVGVSLGLGGTTGKIAGKVVDAETGSPLVGVNIILEDTYMGASTDVNGEYYILNVSPGMYTLRAEMIGYRAHRIREVMVKTDLTTTIDIELSQTVLDLGEMVEVVAERPIVQKDITSGRSIVSSDEIQAMPVESFEGVLSTKAGITTGAGGELHIRGGRSSEIGYMIDGMPVSDPVWGGMAVNVENSVIQELQVVSGTFNAEYGQAMSGVVNIVTKDGGRKFRGDVSMYMGDYVSDRTEKFMNIDNIDPLSIWNIDVSLSGPVPLFGDKLTFFTSTRQYSNQGFLFGKREHNPWDAMYLEEQNIIQLIGEPWADQNDNGELDWDDYGVDGLPNTNDAGESDGIYQDGEEGEMFWDLNNSRQWDEGSPYRDKIVVPDPFYDANGNGQWDEGEEYFDMNHDGEWTDGRSGDNEYVPLEPYEKSAYQAKLTYRLTNSMKLKYNILANFRTDQHFSSFSTMTHDYRYNPDGRPTDYNNNITHMIDFIHTLTSGLYYTAKYTLMTSDFKRYLYEDWDDPRYMPGVLHQRPGYEFLSGGTYNTHQTRNTQSSIFDFDITYQMNKTHQLKAGIESKTHEMDFHEFVIYINNENNWTPEKYRPDNSTSNDRYDDRSPKEFSVYAQDKIELRDMIVNVGLRYDRFDPDWKIPADPEDMQLKISVRDSLGLSTKPASVKHQFSPRLGIAYPITDRGIIHFSYGHFFQIPPFAYLYSNPEFEVTTGRANLMGNADLDAQRTITYELGLQQGLSDDVRLEFIGYYKDVHDLTSTDLVHRLPSGDVYSQYTNRDYGNVKGVTISLEKRKTGLVGFAMDYTFQIAEGNNSDPTTAYYNNQTDPPKATVKKVLPLTWDQTHTFNAMVNLGQANSWGLTLVGRFNTGQPYTPQFQGYDLANINSGRKPNEIIFDMYSFKDFYLFESKRITVFLKVYNLFDRLNERYVFDDTGRATYSLIPTYVSDHGGEYGRHDLSDYLNYNWYYSDPREVRFGLSFGL